MRLRSLVLVQNGPPWKSHQDSFKEKSDMAATKSELEEAREAGKIAARKELGKWLEDNMLKGPYRTVYSDIFPSMVERLKAGKPL
jgi:hypothetical protein